MIFLFENNKLINYKMKRKVFLKKLTGLTLCCVMLCSCAKKVSSNPIVVIQPIDSTIKNNIVFKDLVTTDWKGIVWDAYNKDWNNVATIKDAQQIAAAGIQWTRLWVTADKPNAVNDSMVIRCTNNNIKIVACYVKSNPSNDLGDSTQQAEQVISLKNFVSRYKNTIKYYEIGNEPNLISYWNTTPGAYVSSANPGEAGRGSTDPNSIYNAGVRRYVQWLHLAYNAIKQTDSSATVILGGVSSYIMSDFMDRFTIEKGYLYCDEVAYHPYAETADLSISRLNDFKAKLTTWPAPKNNPPIWITEIGFQNADENVKATQITELMPKLIKNLSFSRPIFWYILHDNAFGLLSQAVSGNAVTTTFFPAYYSYQGLNQSWNYYQVN